MNIKIIRSKTRTKSIQISINKFKQVTVKAPFKTSKAQIKNFISEHKTWITKTLNKIPNITQKTFTEGKEFLLLGKPYPLMFIKGGSLFRGDPYKTPIVSHKKCKLTIVDNCFYLYYKTQTPAQPDIKNLFVKFYKQFGLNYATTTSEHYANLINKKYNKITIKNVSTRWGSCSSKNNLNYNLRLFMAPIEVVNYVIAHEVAHLKHQNHSKKFWECVQSIYPTYKIQKKWLRQNGHLLTI